jgi:hypothetical protein
MTDPSFDEERELRSALGTLLADEPAPQWVVADDVARGRTHLARRRARLGGGIALVAVLALVVGLVGPWRTADDANPLPLGSATPTSVPSDASAAVADYLASIGWPVTSTNVTMNVDDGAVTATTYAVREATSSNVTASLVVHAWSSSRQAALSPTGRGRVGSLLWECLPSTCTVTSSLVGCTGGDPNCFTEEFGVFTRPSGPVAAGTVVLEHTYVDGTQLEGAASPAVCQRCQSLVLMTPFITTQQLSHVLELTGKPALRDAPTPIPSTVLPTVNAETPNPYYVAHNPDRAWARDVLDAASTYVAQQGATASGPGSDGLSLGLARGNERAWLEVGYATTTTDAPECLGKPNCTVLQPWTSARGGTVDVALTRMTLPPNVSCAALCGPSYQLLVRSGHRLVRLEEGTTFGTLLNGDVQGFVLSADQLLRAADLLSFPPPSPTPSAS